jgi:transcriptional regulator with XRE-family HTH domain
VAESPKPPKIGKNIQELRKKRGFTLEQLAKSSGVSKSMLFQIEQAKANPSVTTVWKIARGLNLSFHDILSGDKLKESSLDVLRKRDASILVSEDGKCAIRATSTVRFSDHLETYHLRFQPKGVLASGPHFVGTEEYLTVLRGRLRVTAGKDTTDLASGDSLRFPADTKHSIRNVSDSMAEAVLLVHHRESFPQTLRKHSHGS